MMMMKMMTICQKWGIWLEMPRVSVSNSDASLSCLLSECNDDDDFMMMMIMMMIEYGKCGSIDASQAAP